jgi:basic membrane lipoprotein Med (substrate-binding protein (PBP1-ABC) superfamily)
MGEKINKEYEDFQKYLNKKEKKLKLLVGFELDENLEEVIKELNNKEIVL